jgi:hypothetical protein
MKHRAHEKPLTALIVKLRHLAVITLPLRQKRRHRRHYPRRRRTTHLQNKILPHTTSGRSWPTASQKLRLRVHFNLPFLLATRELLMLRRNKFYRALLILLS